MARIFLCHANEDKPQVREVYRRLKAEGFEPWLDEEDLLPGQLWDQEIRKTLRDSDFILIFFSQISVAKRGYVQREMKLALDAWQEIPEGQIHTIPVRLDACVIPERFKPFQWVDLFEERGLERIICAIRFQQSQHQQVAPRSPLEEDREGTIRSYITKEIEALRHTPGGPFLYGDLTKQVPKTCLTEEIVRVIEQMRFIVDTAIDGTWSIKIVGRKPGEECAKETSCVLDYLAKFIPPAQEVYPKAFQQIEIGVPLTEQRVWKERRKS